MNNLTTSLIRTYVPMIVGSVASYLALKGLVLDAETITALTAGLGGVLAAVYYLVARLLERKFPQLGILLGSVQKPVYVEPGDQLLG